MVQKTDGLRKVLPYEVSLLNLRRTFALSRECWFKCLMIPTAQSLSYTGSKRPRTYSARNPTQSLFCPCKHMKLMSKLGLAWGPETSEEPWKGQVLGIQAVSPGRKGEVTNYTQIVTFSAWMKERMKDT